MDDPRQGAIIRRGVSALEAGGRRAYSHRRRSRARGAVSMIGRVGLSLQVPKRSKKLGTPRDRQEDAPEQHGGPSNRVGAERDRRPRRGQFVILAN